MSNLDSAHIAGCEVCTKAVVEEPRPFDSDLCHMDIRPGNDYGELEPVQCPHLAIPGSARLCTHHLEAAHASYARLIEQTASFN